MGCGTAATEGRGLENDRSSGFESLIVFVIIFTGKINCNYKSELTFKMLNVSMRLYYCHHHHHHHHHHNGHITPTVIL